MERVFDKVPEGLPETYPASAPETGAQVVEWKEANRRIFNTLHELNPSDSSTGLIRLDRYGQESFDVAPGGIFLPDQVGFLVIFLFPAINNLGPDAQRLARLDAGAAYSPRLRELKLMFEPGSPGTEYEHWAFLFKVAERLS